MLLDAQILEGPEQRRARAEAAEPAASRPGAGEDAGLGNIKLQLGCLHEVGRGDPECGSNRRRPRKGSTAPRGEVIDITASRRSACRHDRNLPRPSDDRKDRHRKRAASKNAGGGEAERANGLPDPHATAEAVSGKERPGQSRRPPGGRKHAKKEGAAKSQAWPSAPWGRPLQAGSHPDRHESTTARRRRAQSR